METVGFHGAGRDVVRSSVTHQKPTELSVGWASSRTLVIMEIFLVDGVPETTLSLALFKNVKNAAHLKSKYLNQVALLDAGKRLSSFTHKSTVVVVS